MRPDESREIRIVPADAPGAIELASRRLREGKLVALPTETVYGLAARAADEAAVRSVFEAKGRPSTHPLIVHVRGAEDALAYASEWRPRVAALAAAFWPGPLTLVVPKRDNVSSIITGGGDSVALRAPRHPVARAVLERLGEGFVAPSANRYQTISPTRAEHVATSLAGSPVDVLVIDGGPCSEGLESTVLDVRGDVAHILRPGMIGRDAIAAVWGGPVDSVVSSVGEGPRASPGMDRRHYAPQARLEVAASRELATLRAAELAPRKVARVSFGPSAGAVALPADAAEASRELYDLLHRLDAEGFEYVIVEAPPPEISWEALRDRITRAAGD